MVYISYLLFAVECPFFLFLLLLLSFRPIRLAVFSIYLFNLSWPCHSMCLPNIRFISALCHSCPLFAVCSFVCCDFHFTLLLLLCIYDSTELFRDYYHCLRFFPFFFWFRTIMIVFIPCGCVHSNRYQIYYRPSHFSALECDESSFMIELNFYVAGSIHWIW